MIITRTPFRISFLGGGTDYPAWFKEHGGCVLATTIDKYCYIMVRQLPPNFKEQYRIVYSKEEFVDKVEDIDHPAIRACLKFADVKEGLEIVHWSDLPARKGIGSSSAFVVGLLKALGFHGFKHATHVEQDILKENVGCQDQILSDVGGFLKINFNPEGGSHFSIPYTSLANFLMLFDTGTHRVASDIAGQFINEIPQRTEELESMMKLVDAGVLALREARYQDFGKLLHNSWMLKRELSDNISNEFVDGIYSRARELGAIGGKLLGAGAGGFMVFFVEPEKQEQVKQGLGLKHIPFKFENTGSTVIYDSNSQF